MGEKLKLFKSNKKEQQQLPAISKTVLLIVLAAGLAVGLLYATLNSGLLDNKNVAETTRLDRIDTINNLLLAGDQEGALSLIDAAILDTSESEELSELYILKSTVIAARGDLEGALDVALEANEIDSNYGTVSNIVNLAYVLDDKALLIEFLPQQIQLLEATDPLYEDTKRTLESLLEEVNE